MTLGEPADNSFKQATVGDCNIPRPGGINLKGQMKWDAWNSVRGKPPPIKVHMAGMSNQDAKEHYVALVKEDFTKQGANF
jgi:diazepam-binding inhibitor (GABA receptor modulator, acyl-CoA-binding protein)